MKRSADIMGASADPQHVAQGARFRARLTTALQAVHQRNEVHITARELKAAVSYILFGFYSCEDLHANPALTLHSPSDHVFDPDSGSAPRRAAARAGANSIQRWRRRRGWIGI